MNQTERNLHSLDRLIEKKTIERDVVLRRFRLSCKHLSVAEMNTHPPRRICKDCGAEEEGWHCGYQVLYNDEPKRTVATVTDSMFYTHRRDWPLYEVGQSHEAFGPGTQTYKQLTAIPVGK